MKTLDELRVEQIELMRLMIEKLEAENRSLRDIAERALKISDDLMKQALWVAKFTQNWRDWWIVSNSHNVLGQLRKITEKERGE